MVAPNIITMKTGTAVPCYDINISVRIPVYCSCQASTERLHIK